MSWMLALGLPSGGEWVVIFVVVFLLFGAKKLPELARGIGKSMGEFKKAREEFNRELEESTKESESAPSKTIAKSDSSDKEKETQA